MLIRLLILTAAITIGCDTASPPTQAINKADPLPEEIEAIKQDKRVQALQEYAAKRMERLLTKTGTGIKSINWDFSQGNQISIVGWPKNEDSHEFLINQDVDVIISLPEEMHFQNRATLVNCDRGESTSDRLESIRLQLPKCTTEEAFKATRAYITRWKLQKQFTTDGALSALDDWLAGAKSGSDDTFLAARHDNYPIIDVGIRRSFDTAQPWFISIDFSIGKPPLPKDVVACFDSIRTGDVENVARLLEAGLSPNSRNVLDESLLHHAAEYGRIELCDKLIERGAQVDAEGSWMQTPFRIAILHGHFDLGQLLLDKGANIDSPSHNGGTVLSYVCEYLTDPVPNHKVAQWLIEHGARVGATDSRGDTPLHKSAWKGHLAAAIVLINSNANIDAINNDGMTPLDCATNQRQTELEMLLRKNGAQPGTSQASTE